MGRPTKNKKKEFKAIWAEAVAEVEAQTRSTLTLSPDDPILTDRRYQVRRWQGVWKDETGQVYQFLQTGDDRYYLVYPLLGESSIICGEGVPILKSSLPHEMRRALNAGWSNTHFKSLLPRLKSWRERAGGLLI